MRKIVLVLLFIIYLQGCISDIPPEEYTTSVDTTSVDTTQFPIVEETSTPAKGVYAIKIIKSIEINNQQIFPYHKDSKGIVHNNSTFTFILGNNIEVLLREGGFTYSSVYIPTEEWKGNMYIDRIEYFNTVKAEDNILYNIKLTVDNNKELIKIDLGNRTFLKKNNTPRISTNNLKLQYANNHEIIVQKGQTLKVIIQLYNAENYNTPIDLNKVLELNPVLKTRKNYKTIVGEIIKINAN